ncbi:MAG TPA: CPBP family intramembrane glutamic endopeptidase [Terriglobia bacterium]|nr:CPBP family intramembrane glutamic endopeptidase [Terriglobia bacterium]
MTGPTIQTPIPGPPEKLNRTDFRLVFACVAIAAASLWVAIVFFSRVFPEASIEFRVNRDTSQPIALDFLEKLRPDRSPRIVSSIPNLRNYRHAAIFDYDDTAKTFLERNLGLEKANQIMGRQVRLWHWSHRWFRPQQKEEVQVDVSPGGEIVRFAHLVDEAAKGADLGREDAQALAEEFLQKVVGKNVLELDFVEVNSEKREHRTDHLFRWKSRQLQLGDAQYRYSVTIQGSEIGAYDEALKVPEEWTRDYQKLRSLNETTSEIAFIFLAATVLAMLIVLVRNIRHSAIPWRFSALLGLAAFVLTLLSQLNNLPVSEFLFNTTNTYGSFIVQRILRALMAAGGSGASIFLIAACAEPLYRQDFPQRISLPNLFTWPGLRSKEFLIGTIVGVTMTFFFFAYDSIFYLIANRLGAWAPAEVPYTDLLNTRIPWVYVLFFGFFPAVSEEFISRAFSIPFFRQIFHFRWLAVFLASFIWGFAHANYPNQPFYIRGIEVGIGGLIISWVFLRFGIIAPLVWHYSVDALYTAFLLLRSKDVYLAVSGALSAGIMLIPLVVALGAYLRCRAFQSASGLLNSQIEPVEEKPMPVVVVEERSIPSYLPLTNNRRWALVFACLLLLPTTFIPVVRFGSFLNIAVDRTEARRNAERFLEQQGVNWRSFQSVVYYDQDLDPIAAQYLLKHSGPDMMNRIYSQSVKAAYWIARFYRPLEEEEYLVFIDPHDGRVSTFSHKISENAPGADLGRVDAQQAAERYLKSRGIPLNQIELKEANSEKRKARRDYSFVWQMKENQIGESTIRLDVHLCGDQVTSFSPFVKVPEEWQRSREKTTFFHIVTYGARFLVIGFLGGWAFWSFLQNVRRGQIRWKPVLVVAFGLVALQILTQVNALPVIFRDYNTSVTPRIFALDEFSRFFISLIFQLLFSLLVIGLVVSLHPKCQAIWHLRARFPYAKDALWLAISIACAKFGLSALEGQLVHHFHQYALIPSLPYLEEVNHWIPAISTLGRAFQSSIIYSSILGVYLFVLTKALVRSASRLLFLLLTLLSLQPSLAVTPGEWVSILLIHAVLLLLVLLGIRYYARDNVLAYISIFFVLSLSQSAYEFIRQYSSFLKWNGVFLLLVACAFLLNLIRESRNPVLHSPLESS